MSLFEYSPFRFARLGTKALAELAGHLDTYIQGRLWAKILFALALGLGFGFLLGPEIDLIPKDWSQVVVSWLAVPGQLFLSIIQLVIIPLVFASVVLGIVSGESVRQLRRLGIRVGIYYILTTVIAITIGFGVAFIMSPGKGFDISALPQSSQAISIEDSSQSPPTELNFSIGQLIPNNPFTVFIEGEMLQIVILALFFGIALMSLKDEEAEPLVGLLNSFQKISMVIIGWAMRLAPLAVFCLTAQLLAQLGTSAVFGLGYYVLSVCIGLFVMLLVYLIIVSVVVKYNPMEFLKHIREVQLLAFSTSSSASVMPLTMETAQNKLQVAPSVAQFTIPLGATINMDGTALYQGMATVFLAQVFQVDLSLSQLVLVSVTATLSSIGAPGAPGVGMAILSTLLASVGIPPSGIILILGVDRILDMCRTVINVTGDLTSALVMNRFMGHKVDSR